MNGPRIVSLLPSATEMAYALGLGGQVVGVTHECDFSPEARTRPVVVRPALPLEKMSPRDIDTAVSERLRRGQSLYEVDEHLLARLRPDLILTQNLCQVCAPSGNELAAALKVLAPAPEVLWMSPHTLDDILQNIHDLGQATDRVREAETLITTCRARLEKIAACTRALPRRPRVFCMEWADPVYGTGHWAPEMVALAGGTDALARRGADSARVPWENVVDWAPEVLIFAPCGFNLAQALAQKACLESLPGWADLPAVRDRRVFAIDANSYLARPGPRVVDGTELLAHLIHPTLFSWSGPADAFAAIPGPR